MQQLKLQFLYGQEFWDKLKQLLINAQERVFLLSAYIGKKTYDEYIKLIPENVYSLTICRSDSNYIPNDALKIDQSYFHGKLYLIDNTVIIGSQNLYEANKEGEFSTLIETDSFNSSLILYQALLKLIEKESITAEPVNKNFADLYQNGCPFCGNTFIPDPISLHTCPGYGGNFVSNDDCQSYAGGGSCKYCIEENRIEIGDAICCDDNGCGLGISLTDYNLLHHAINPVTKNDLNLAREYLKLFNFFQSQDKDAVKLFEILGFVGEVYKTSLERKEHHLVNYNSIKNTH
ncbi:hypothetical protein BBH99_07225 [Chryseobacterium contaminans]|uniref:PLD phosphodiesterase domain-containing protein n=1 Tax=Chryseobacterium contaminans TaxID=1423959 RepID=A0A1M7D9P7_9FLAO|nr:hypothetical protein [Chryseobacterium contaminans]OCA78877.1 hypothetical protein BBH99_07225 [Chryseobacterium contaminans]SHL76138.1 hypothetical protein SAMN05444407_10626 [Chryseobacterium contaminans]